MAEAADLRSLALTHKSHRKVRARARAIHVLCIHTYKHRIERYLDWSATAKRLLSRWFRCRRPRLVQLPIGPVGPNATIRTITNSGAARRRNENLVTIFHEQSGLGQQFGMRHNTINNRQPATHFFYPKRILRYADDMLVFFGSTLRIFIYLCTKCIQQLCYPPLLTTIIDRQIIFASTVYANFRFYSVGFFFSFFVFFCIECA